MEVRLFARMLGDKHCFDYKRLKYKYPASMDEFLKTLEELYYQRLPLPDFEGKELVFLPTHAAVSQKAVKLLLREQSTRYGVKAAEEEILSTSAIESIDLSRDSVRNILRGKAPEDEQEQRIYGIKKGFDFIADGNNEINEENLYRLYQMTVGDHLEEGERLREGYFYRHDSVYIVDGESPVHCGLHHSRIPEYMRALITFINTEDDINDLIKAAIIHFYLNFIHPYFDGNGRMARLLHVWYLIRRGYRSTTFVSFSSCIERSRKAYYDAFTAVENNRRISGIIDVTPFVVYFVRQVYHKMSPEGASENTLSAYNDAKSSGLVTPKEDQLWKFVLSFYGTSEFSTKQLEKEFGNAAYATIRAFVIKFERLGLLVSVSYGSRTKYHINEG